MLYKMKDYQRKSVDQLKKYFNFYFDQKDKTIVFKSPTGSGKTFMISSMIDELVKENEEKDFCFVWASIGKGELHIQSYEAVRSYLGGYPKCSLMDYEFFGTRSYIKKHEIVFVNWEKLVQKDSTTGKWKNNLMKDQEGISFIEVISETKKRNSKIILIIDESHIGKSVESRIIEFKETILQPDLTIEMSATPLSKPDIIVDLEDVIAEGMLKENLIVNEGINSDIFLRDDITSEELVLEYGYQKRLQLLNEYINVDSKVNPLCLIQIPNTDQGDAKLQVIQDYLRKYNITLDNGKLKIWLSGKDYDFNKKKIKSNDDETEFLVFKTAVATGWDCPRAHILVKFREGNSETFEIQTIGRILRTAEAKSYGNYILDNAYIFTNLSQFETKKDSYNPNKIKTEMSYFRLNSNKQPIYTPIKIKSFYRSRQDDYNSADSGFYEVFENEFCAFFGIDIGSSDYKNPEKMLKKGFKDADSNIDLVIRETSVSTNYVDDEKRYFTATIEVKSSDSDIMFSYYDLISQNLNGLAYVRSRTPINGAIIECFTKYYYHIPRSIRIMKIQKLVVQNKNIFAEIISKSTKKYREILIERAGKKGKIIDFEIQPQKSYSNETHKVVESKLSLYQPLRMLITDHNKNQVNQLEYSFIKFLDQNDKYIDWHWHNGSEVVETNFGIPYNNGLSTFQPDFIVKFKNGNIGIFDTKPIGERVEDTTLKSEALYKYIKESNSSRDLSLGRIVGGIVVSRNNKDFYFYNQEKYIDYSESSENWIGFENLFNIN